MTSREFLKRLHVASNRAREEMLAQGRSGGKYGQALAGEGRLGGYLQALSDVDGMLRLGQLLSNNPDSKRWWQS